MELWPVAYEQVEIQSRFGTTHVVISGPKNASPLVLLHGYMATLTMWSPNIADFSTDHRVYAIDVMGQPSKSVPAEPIQNANDYRAWLAATLDALNLDRTSLVGMSYGGWLALNFAVGAPDRVQKLVLLSPAASFLPIARQFSLRGLLMLFFPTRLTVNSFMGWLGFHSTATEVDAWRIVDLMYLGLKHFRLPPETLRVVINVFSDEELRELQVPVLLLVGDKEVIYDPARALDRARRLLPNFDGALVPGACHDMCFTQYRLVDQRVVDFLKDNALQRRPNGESRGTSA